MHYIITALGCKVNQYEAQAIETLLHPHGFTAAGEGDPVDLIVVNTCAVTAEGGRKSRQMIRKLREEHPQALCAVCGCWSQLSPEDAAAIGADVVHGSGSKQAFVDDILRAFREHTPVTCVDNPFRRFDFEPLPAGAAYGRTRAMLKIQDGCNNFCTYCVVPYVRGRERSRLPEDVVAEARQLVAEGYKDITLLGQNVNSYGKDLDSKTDFSDLLRMINDIPGDFILRFMTSHPKDATEKLFKTMAECEKCAHHIHLPVQSGNDHILKMMNRNYTREKYLSQVATARRYMPDIVITTDIIVGFPNETEEEFEDTISLCEEVRFDAMFTFIYSKRVGTPAASMPDPYTRADKQKHFDRLMDVSNRISGEKHKEYEGKTVRVLVDGETGREEYNLSSRTNGGRLVHLHGDKSLIGQFVNVKIVSSNTWALYGEIEKG